MKISYIFLLIASIGISSQLNAQFSLSGELRPRTEISHGYGTLSEKDQEVSTFTAQRTRLNFLFKTESIHTKLVLQDVRTWGSQSQLVTNEDYATSIHEAWAEVFFSSEFSLKTGRQELVYDDQRILGSVGWAHQARSHDIAVLKYEKNIKFHFGIAHHENTNRKNNIYDGNDAYKNLQYIWFNKKWNNEKISILVLNNGVPTFNGSNEICRYTQTFGGNLSFKIKSTNVVSNFYFQTGESISGLDVSAFNFLLELSQRVSNNTFLVGYELLSGTSFDETSKNKSFTPLYGTNHKFNGFMDYFYVGNHFNSVGLHDAYFKYSFIKNKFGLNADIHLFATHANIESNLSKYLGTEIDLSLNWNMNKYSNFSFGLSKMLASDSMVLIKGGDNSAGQYWAYLMLTVKPSFIE